MVTLGEPALQPQPDPRRTLSLMSSTLDWEAESAHGLDKEDMHQDADMAEMGTQSDAAAAKPRPNGSMPEWWELSDDRGHKQEQELKHRASYRESSGFANECTDEGPDHRESAIAAATYIPEQPQGRHEAEQQVGRDPEGKELDGSTGTDAPLRQKFGSSRERHQEHSNLLRAQLQNEQLESNLNWHKSQLLHLRRKNEDLQEQLDASALALQDKYEKHAAAQQLLERQNAELQAQVFTACASTLKLLVCTLDCNLPCQIPPP